MHTIPAGIRQRYPEDRRTDAQIREHYELEKRLAERLKASTVEERQELYGRCYDELYASLPHHPRHSRQTSEQQLAQHVASQMQVLEQFLKPDAVFVEVGSGDGSLLRAVAPRVRAAYGIEVSAITATTSVNVQPRNAVSVIYDGQTLPFQQQRVTLVFSNAVMEHLHPDDAFEQIRGIAQTLAPGGKYVFYTPHRFMGPGDVSKYFDTVATGFHLKEYTYRELRRLLRAAGYSSVAGLVRFRGRYRVVPIAVLILNELVLSLLPYGIRHKLAWNRLMQRLVQIRIVAAR
jgi:SAM-dependent methyltransferase